ncbi:MAG: hypothetical protein KR126chlam3_00924 [Chlamydiae bacterium]|nr:hypothetical protein [Chlamydiota bacterium]
MLKFSHMIFYVKEVADTVSFYQKAFGLNIKFFHESGMYAELDTGGTSLSFASEQMAESNLPNGYQSHTLDNPPFANEIVFVSNDVVRDFKQAVGSGAVALVEPEEKPWGQLVGYVRDPNGILIEIASEIKSKESE